MARLLLLLARVLLISPEELWNSLDLAMCWLASCFRRLVLLHFPGAQESLGNDGAAPVAGAVLLAVPFGRGDFGVPVPFEDEGRFRATARWTMASISSRKRRTQKGTRW